MKTRWFYNDRGVLVPDWNGSWYWQLPKQAENAIAKLTKRRFGMPKYQKGILHPLGFWKEESGAAGTLTLTTLNESSNIDSGPVSCGYRYQIDGTRDYIGFSNSWINHGGGEWIDDATDYNQFEAKYDHVTGNAPTRAGFSAENTYTTISTDMSWTLSTLSSSQFSNGTTQIREILDTANTTGDVSYSMDCESFGGGGIFL